MWWFLVTQVTVLTFSLPVGSMWLYDSNTMYESSYAGVVSLATRRLSNISVNRPRRRNKSSIADVSKKKRSNVDVSKWRQKNVNVRKHSDVSVSN